MARWEGLGPILDSPTHRHEKLTSDAVSSAHTGALPNDLLNGLELINPGLVANRCPGLRDPSLGLPSGGPCSSSGAGLCEVSIDMATAGVAMGWGPRAGVTAPRIACCRDSCAAAASVGWSLRRRSTVCRFLRPKPSRVFLMLPSNCNSTTRNTMYRTTTQLTSSAVL